MNRLKATVGLLSVLGVFLGALAVWAHSGWRLEAADQGGLQPGLIAGGIVSTDAFLVMSRSGNEIASMPTPCRYPKVFGGRLFCLNNKSTLHEIVDREHVRLIGMSESYHHDFHVDIERSEILALSREKTKENVGGESYKHPLISDNVKILDMKGKEKWSWRLLDHVATLEKIYEKDFPFGKLKRFIKHRAWARKAIVDWSHMNGVTVLSGAKTDDPRFRNGQIVVTIGALGSILVIDRDSKQIVRATAVGKFSLLHRPIDLGGGKIAFLHNGHEERRSEVVIYDLVADKVVKRITPNIETDFFVLSGGTLQLLSNGNYLVGMEQFGKIFELGQDGRILWSYQNPRVHDLPAGVKSIFLTRTSEFKARGRLKHFASKIGIHGPVLLEPGIAEKFSR